MAPGSLKSNWKDRASPLTLLSSISLSVEDEKGKNYGPHNPRLFSNGAQEYFDRYGGDITHLAKIASKNHKHSVNNPYSQFRDGRDEEQVLNATKITNQLTKYMCSPTSDGAACAIIASKDFVYTHNLEN